MVTSIEPIMVITFHTRYPIFVEHVSFGCMLLELYQTPYRSNVDVPIIIKSNQIRVVYLSPYMYPLKDPGLLKYPTFTQTLHWYHAHYESLIQVESTPSCFSICPLNLSSIAFDFRPWTNQLCFVNGLSRWMCRCYCSSSSSTLLSQLM